MLHNFPFYAGASMLPPRVLGQGPEGATSSNLVNSRCCQDEDGKEMHQNAKRTCRACRACSGTGFAN